MDGLGNAYQSLGEYQRALDYCEQGLTITKEIGIPSDEYEKLKQKILDAMNA
ncbi:MAG: tetratricopeptide repeat-containing protein [Limnothrix sp. RL_2_0]|nr:tetratricopeptide repeat-containing protein [Limnothrix sp. RL_2_0]